jgi:HSP20 family protein
MSLIKFRKSTRDPLQHVLNVPSVFEPFLNIGWDEPFPSLAENNFPAVDVSEDKEHLYVKADLPGFDKKDIKVNLNDGYLTVEAERKSEVDNKDKTYHRIERTYGLYRRSIYVGLNVEESSIQAKYNNGVLDVTVPKSKPKDVKAIEIKD